MGSRPFVATIRAEHTDQINVRSGPGTTFDVAFTVVHGDDNLQILDVQTDTQKTTLRGKIYQWFQLRFSDQRTGWVRDDLLYIQGDGTAFGYGVLTGRTYAFALTRAIPRQRTLSAVLNEARQQRQQSTTLSPAPIPSPTPEPSPSTQPAQQERIIRAAFNITAGFEGSGYGSYQTYDQGIISYGRFQFTLQSGSLVAVINRFIETTDSLTAQALKKDYLARLTARDVSLRSDDRLQAILEHAAREKAMQDAQDYVAYQQYWLAVYNLSIEPRGIKTPLAQAMFFDIGIQHGTQHNLFSRAERELGVPVKSRVGANGISEGDFVHRVALIRQEILYEIASQQNLPGVRTRADFWLNLIRAKDWNLEGDQDGNVTILGKKVQIRNP
jgi:hypothetical protein